MILETIVAEGLAHLSYLIGDDKAGLAAVIDPRRDIEIYLQLAQQQHVRITHILETHIHADFVSGSCELSARTGAPIYVGAAEGYGFAHRPLRDGDRLTVGGVTLTAMHTPGHTPEHLCYVASEGKDAPPWGVFTGDTLFAGEVGRPDLLGKDTAVPLARQLFHSLHDRLLRLPADVIIHPAHGEGSPCGGNIGGRRTSTIGYEKQNNPRLQTTDEMAFVSSLLESLPKAPTYYPRMKQMNAAGPRLLGTLPDPPLLTPQEFAGMAQAEDAVIVDARTILGFSGGHIHRALSLELREDFPIWAGWMLDPDQNLLIVLRDSQQLDTVVRHFIRIGCERIGGYMSGLRAWQEGGMPLEHLRAMYIQELKEALDRHEEIQVVDVRREDEYRQSVIPTARHLFAAEIERRAGELDRRRPVVTYCGSGYRAAVAASILQRMGFPDVRFVPGSMKAWHAAGYPTASAPSAA